MPSSDKPSKLPPRTRLQVLRELLENEVASTQQDLREELERRDFEVTQSTISRDLRRLGAVKMSDLQGEATYRLPEDPPAVVFSDSIADLITDMRHNGAICVLNTTPGSASLIARHIDHLRSDDILGTIAGDDTVFVAPANAKKCASVLREIQESF